jgi:gas vesicle protein
MADIEKIIKEVQDAIHSGSEKVTDSVTESNMFDKYKDSDDKIGDILEDAGNVVTGWFDAVSDKVEPVVKKTKEKIYESIQEEYRKAGAPYGDTHEGLLRWVDEHETNIREKVNTGLEKARKTILDTAKKTKDFVEEKITENQSASKTTVEGSTKKSEK